MSSNCIPLVKRFLCVKRLTVHDGFTSKSVKLPRAEARFFMGELRNRQATPVVILDEQGNCWELLCTCLGGQYALSRIGAFCEAHQVKPGSYFIFYADHEHIVRLAVREQMPEDVQAAIAAARAALVVRSGCPSQPAEQPQQPEPQQLCPQQQPHGTVEGVPGESFQPVVDEMPLEVSSPGKVNDRAEAAARPVVAAEPLSRPMPLQDRSNLPPCVPVSESAGGTHGKGKPLGPKALDQPIVKNPSGASQLAGNADANKENDSRVAATKPAGSKPHSGPLPSPSPSSTEGLSPPAPSLPSHPVSTSNHSTSERSPAPELSQQPQNRNPPWGPAPQAPSPPNPQPQRNLSVQPVPSPATRLRMRFEARLRAQAGKLHPLSIRTGPESAPPSSSVCSDGPAFGYIWPSALTATHPLHLGIGVRPVLLPGLPWGGVRWPNPATVVTTGFSGPGRQNAGIGRSPDSTASGPDAACGFPGPASGASLRQPAHLTLGGVPGPGEGGWRQQVQCDELLDWEVGRPASAGPGTAAFSLQQQSQQQQQQQSQQQLQQQAHAPAGWLQPAPAPAPPPPASPLQGLMFGQTINLALLRQLLLRQHTLLRPGDLPAGTPHGGAAGADTSKGITGVGKPELASGWGLHRPTQEGVLLSCVSATSTLQQLLHGARPPTTAAAAWNQAAMTARTNTRPEPLDGRSPCSSNLPAEGQASGPGAQIAGGRGVTASHFGLEVFGARAKSGLTAARDAVRAPAELPDSKRQRQQSQSASPGARAGDQERETGSAPRATDGVGLASSPSVMRGRPLARKVLSARELLSGTVSLAVLAPSPLGRDGQAPASSGSADAEGAHAGCTPDAPEPMDSESARGSPIQEASISDGHDTAAAMAGLQPTCGPGDAQQQLLWRAFEGDEAVPVVVTVESGAHYDGVLLLKSSGSCGIHISGQEGSFLQGELQGLLPYLIRRQAGVGDVLELWVEDGHASGRQCLRLRAQLQQTALAGRHRARQGAGVWC